MLGFLKYTFLFIFVAFLIPLGTHAAWWWQKGWSEHWSNADWSSAELLPVANAEPDAVVHVMAARVGRWRGIFAHHSWVVIKPAGADRYVRYDVVGWGRPVRTDHRDADARWFGNEPVVVLTLRGDEATRAIPEIRKAVASYPYAESGSYRAWPGPNSNTFIAYIAQQVPLLGPALLPTALGKDFRSYGLFYGAAPSGQGVQITYDGLFGVTIGWVEGLEINFLGTIAGVDVRRPAIKLPGWGRIGLAPV